MSIIASFTNYKDAAGGNIKKSADFVFNSRKTLAFAMLTSLSYSLAPFSIMGYWFVLPCLGLAIAANHFFYDQHAILKDGIRLNGMANWLEFDSSDEDVTVLENTVILPSNNDNNAPLKGFNAAIIRKLTQSLTYLGHITGLQELKDAWNSSANTELSVNSVPKLLAVYVSFYFTATVAIALATPALGVILNQLGPIGLCASYAVIALAINFFSGVFARKDANSDNDSVVNGIATLLTFTAIATAYFSLGVAALPLIIASPMLANLIMQPTSNLVLTASSLKDSIVIDIDKLPSEDSSALLTNNNIPVDDETKLNDETPENHLSPEPLTTATL